MNLQNPFTADEKRATSPVIGVVLMIGITVVLGTMVGSYMTEFGDGVSQVQPNTQFSFDYEKNGGDVTSITVTHDGGDAVEYKQVKVIIENEIAWEHTPDGDNFGEDFKGTDGDWTSKITSADELTIKEKSDTAIENGDTVTIVWTAEGSDTTAIIGESTVSV